jgi:ADP-dependent NAD(P)H-hydrate dehydratase / NAD(P)H-hydrate epimerase
VRNAFTVSQIRAAEEAEFARLEERGLPADTLMQRAAYGLAYAVVDFLGTAYGRRVRLLVGSGNNGGDTLYAGALLSRRGVRVEAALLSPEGAHQRGLAAFLAAGGRVWRPTATPRAVSANARDRIAQDPSARDRIAHDPSARDRIAHDPSARDRIAQDPIAQDRGPHIDVVIDGIVGIGAHGGLRPSTERAVVECLRDCRDAPIIAVDVPSGMEIDSGEVHGAHLAAELTVTFGSYNVAHLVDPAASACGTVELVDIGLTMSDPVAESLQQSDVVRLLPRAQPSGHKYTRGVVGLRTGSATYPGAAVLSAAGASCGVAGMVRYAGSAAAAVQAAHPEVVVGAGKVQAWVVGSGGGSEARAALESCLADTDFLNPQLTNSSCPLVIDADALMPFVELVDSGSPLPAGVVVTPHAGELARMLGVPRAEVEARQLHFTRQAADRFGVVVLLKGRRSLVAEPGSARVLVNATGVPWLGTAGSGDVLAGLIGALLAAGLRPVMAAAVGAWLHGAAGAVASQGGPITARGIAEALPEVMRQLFLSVGAGD